MRWIIVAQIICTLTCRVFADTSDIPQPAPSSKTRVYIMIQGEEIASHIFIGVHDAERGCILDRWYTSPYCFSPKDVATLASFRRSVSIDVDLPLAELLEQYSTRLHYPIWPDHFLLWQLAFDNCADEVRRVIKYLVSDEAWHAAGQMDLPFALPQVVFNKAIALAEQRDKQYKVNP